MYNCRTSVTLQLLIYGLVIDVSSIGSILYLVALVYQPDVLPEIAVSLPTHRTGSSLFLVDVGQMSLQVSLEVTTVAALSTLVVFQLKIYQASSDWCWPAMIPPGRVVG